MAKTDDLTGNSQERLRKVEQACIFGTEKGQGIRKGFQGMNNTQALGMQA